MIGVEAAGQFVAKNKRETVKCRSDGREMREFIDEADEKPRAREAADAEVCFLLCLSASQSSCSAIHSVSK